ncbi:MAG TPA: hypothetical protein VFX28_22800, partial [Methylomirabilota bacterium]|nr:hypothetical protein [Methylomirabilota bacterium]
TLLNPTPRDIATTLTYYVVGQPAPSTKVIIVPPTSRYTVAVHGDAEGVGRGKGVSIKVEAADIEGLVAERPIYFANGAYSALGAPEARPAWFFAEGYTGPGFAESLVILNPNAGSAAVRLTYYLDTGAPVVKTLTLAGQQRTTINVNDTTLGVGPGRPVSAKVESTNGVTIVAERPMIFTYNGVTPGAHTVIGYAP